MDVASAFADTGYQLVTGLFTAEEVDSLCDHYMALRCLPCLGDEVELDPKDPDPLKRFPRIMQPHRWDVRSKAFLLDPRIDQCLSELLGASPIAVQTMVYFKPPGARGQAMHQDNFYLLAAPGTCAAAWLALDDCDEENGCMAVVPGSHNMPVLCLEDADTSVSFTDVQVPLPPELEPVPIMMKKGDVLFFTGQIIHGSGPNVSKTRFRRSLIAHYVEVCSTQVGKWYQPAYRMDGSEAFLDIAPGRDVCGRFVDGDLTLVSGGHLPNRAH